MTSYYDIDAILAEEELIPCHTNFEFSLLADLDPDGAHHHHHHHRPSSSQRNKMGYNTDENNYLIENTRIKIPLWVAKRWAMPNFVRLQLPRHYGRKARERYDADPGDADLRYVDSAHMAMGYNAIAPCRGPNIFVLVWFVSLSWFFIFLLLIGKKTKRTVLFGRANVGRLNRNKFYSSGQGNFFHAS
jgi:hypothetical protein